MTRSDKEVSIWGAGGREVTSGGALASWLAASDVALPLAALLIRIFCLILVPLRFFILYVFLFKWMRPRSFGFIIRRLDKIYLASSDLSQSLTLTFRYLMNLVW